jgi:hypothetical protein
VENVEQDDDGDRDAEKPQQERAHSSLHCFAAQFSRRCLGTS